LSLPSLACKCLADYEQDASGALLALSLGATVLAHLGSAAPWLAKEVVWLLPDASCGLLAAMQAWADAYQRPVSSRRDAQQQVLQCDFQLECCQL
jgi:hypothetical protein